MIKQINDYDLIEQLTGEESFLFQSTSGITNRCYKEAILEGYATEEYVNELVESLFSTSGTSGTSGIDFEYSDHTTAGYATIVYVDGNINAIDSQINGTNGINDRLDNLESGMTSDHTTAGYATISYVDSKNSVIDNVYVLENGTNSTSSNVFIITDEKLLLVDTNLIYDITLPNSLVENTVLTIKDKSGLANTNNILLNGIIDGQASYIMSSSYESIRLLFNNGKYYKI